MRRAPEGMLAYAANITNQPADRWRLTREEAIRRIEAKEETFYTTNITIRTNTLRARPMWRRPGLFSQSACRAARFFSPETSSRSPMKAI